MIDPTANTPSPATGEAGAPPPSGSAATSAAGSAGAPPSDSASASPPDASDTAATPPSDLDQAGTSAPDPGPVDRSVSYAEVPNHDRLSSTPARSTSPDDPPGLRDIASSAVDATLAVGSVAVQGIVGVSAMVLRRFGASFPARWTKTAASSALENRNSEIEAVGRAAEDQINKIIAVFVPVIVDSLDPSELMAKVDVNALMDRVDLNALLSRVDVNALVDRVDIDKMLDGVDLKALMERADIGDLVAQSTSQMAGSTLDVGRRQIVGLDTVMMRVVDRALGRQAQDQPLGPPELVPSDHETEVD